MEPKEKQEQEQKRTQQKKKERTPCEIFSRVVGFLTPLSQWNVGKREEFRQRKTYDKALREARFQDSQKEEKSREKGSEVSSGTSSGASSTE